MASSAEVANLSGMDDLAYAIIETEREAKATVGVANQKCPSCGVMDFLDPGRARKSSPSSDSMCT